MRIFFQTSVSQVLCVVHKIIYFTLSQYLQLPTIISLLPRTFIFKHFINSFSKKIIQHRTSHVRVKSKIKKILCYTFFRAGIKYSCIDLESVLNL